LNGPFTPDLATPLSKFPMLMQEKGWKDEVSAALIGSCTNSSYEDMVSMNCPFLSHSERGVDPCGRTSESSQGSWPGDASSIPMYSRIGTNTSYYGKRWYYCIIGKCRCYSTCERLWPVHWSGISISSIHLCISTDGNIVETS
jgi:hypothetical protein